ncbi:MAG: N-acetylmuramoyl-L-alanine amidase [Actinomycetota bacterium]|nr:N-acetylmuramoyl-L-alanine amidase [Actinomycetota bacterium]
MAFRFFMGRKKFPGVFGRPGFPTAISLLISLLLLCSVFFSFPWECAFAYTPVVCLDPGHGGRDPGAISSSGFQEKEANLDVGLKVRDQLQAVGCRVVMTRENDSYPSLQCRCDIANNANADIFVSIHSNFAVSSDGSPNSQAGGTETYYYAGSTKGSLLAACVQEEVVKQIDGIDRGTKTAGFYVLAGTRMPACLLECVFLSNTDEERLLQDPAFRQRIANGIFNGIVRYLEQTTGFQVFYPLPQYFRIHVPKVTSNTRIQISTYFTSTKWVSQPILAPGDYLIRIDPDGFVRSIDSKLAFAKSPDGTSPALSIYILHPDQRNGADFASYAWSTTYKPQGAIRWSSSGYLNFDDGSIVESNTGNTIAITGTRETIYPDNLMLRVHLESVTPHTYLEIPFYWKRIVYRSQKPLPPGDYWIQVCSPGGGGNPYLLSLDGRIYFRQFATLTNPDPVFAVYIALPNRPEVGFDVVGFVRDFKLPNTYQTILGAEPTGPDVGLGFVSCTGLTNPARASTRYPTIPTQTLTGGNYIIVTDAGLIRGKVTADFISNPLPGARVTINGCSIFTDARGEFAFTHMVPGVYTLEYDAPGCKSQTQVIHVGAGRPTYPPTVIMSH